MDCQFGLPTIISIAAGFACPPAEVAELAMIFGQHGKSPKFLASSATDISKRPRHHDDRR
jgi:hypothetical protein